MKFSPFFSHFFFENSIFLKKRGTYGNVVKAVHIENKFPAAIKIIDKAKIEENEIKIREKQKWRIQNEIEIHKSLHHENIVEFFTYYESDVDICIVMEL